MGLPSIPCVDKKNVFVDVYSIKRYFHASAFESSILDWISNAVNKQRVRAGGVLLNLSSYSTIEFRSALNFPQAEVSIREQKQKKVISRCSCMEYQVNLSI